jgi:hypothetical protein
MEGHEFRIREIAAGCCEHGNEPLDSIKIRGISSLAEELPSCAQELLRE